MAKPPDRRISLAVARAIPVVLLGCIIYACYAITKPLCIDYLIHPLPQYDRSSRVGAGAAILAVFYILLLLMLVTYARLLYTVVWNPDLLPRSPALEHTQSRQSQDKPRRKRKGHRKSKRDEISDKPTGDVERALDYNAGSAVLPWDVAGLESFYTKDVFVCQPDGRPVYCSKCCHFKPDRTHHCREVDRCVRKMDHFCPWVGGVVSEVSFKFFIQFVFYTALFCIFVMIVCAIFVAELKKQTSEVNPHWVIGIGLSGFFGMFTFGMTMSSLQLASSNLTTIENLNKRSAVWTLAIRVPNHLLSRFQPGSQWAPTFHTITYPLPSIPPSQPLQPQPPVAAQPQAEQTNQPNTPQPPALPTAIPPLSSTSTPHHTFAILQTLPGENPFALSTPLKNLQQVLGHSISDWLFPIKHSPCSEHTSAESEFAMGPVVKRLRREVGLDGTTDTQSNTDTTNNVDGAANGHGHGHGSSHSKHKRRRGKKHHHHHHQHESHQQQHNSDNHHERPE